MECSRSNRERNKVSDTQESVKPPHKHRRGVGRGMVAALGFGRLSKQLVVPQEPTSSVESESVSDECPAPEESENVCVKVEMEQVPESHPIEPMPEMRSEMKEPERVNETTNTGMSYIEAIQSANDGWHVRRTGWSEGIYVFVEDGARIMKCTQKDHLPHQGLIGKFTPLVNDVLSNDWEKLLIPSKTFQEAIAAMVNGYYARRSSWQYFLQIKEGQFCSPDNPQQECTMRYEDMTTSDWEIHAHC